MLWLTLAIVVAGIGWFLRSWTRWHLKQRGDANELDWLDEMVREHEAGTHDHSDHISRLIRDIECQHDPSQAVSRELRRAREALARTSGQHGRVTPSA